MREKTFPFETHSGLAFLFSPRRTAGSPKTTPLIPPAYADILSTAGYSSGTQEYRLHHNRHPSLSRSSQASANYILNPSPLELAALAVPIPFSPAASLPNDSMQQHIFKFGSEPQNTTTPQPASSHCSSVQERLATYGSEALNSVEHLGLIVGSQSKAEAMLQHFGSLPVLARASVQELLRFLSRTKALRLVSSLRMGAVVLREERQSLTIDSPLAIAELLMRIYGSREERLKPAEFSSSN